MEKILIVETDMAICKAFSKGLTTENVRIDIANNGKSAISMHNDNYYDVIIIELYLPDMNGLDVIRKMKGVSPELISIVITSSNSMKHTINAIRLGINDYYEKPVDLPTLKSSIKKLLNFLNQKRNNNKQQLLEMFQINNNLHSINKNAEIAINNLNDKASIKDRIKLIMEATGKISELLV